MLRRKAFLFLRNRWYQLGHMYSNIVISERIEPSDIHMTLENPLKNNHYMNFNHILPMISALIQSNKLVYAERIFFYTEQEMNDQWKKQLTSALPNMFIQAYCQSSQPQIHKVYEWYLKFEKYGLNPDSITFGFLLKLCFQSQGKFFISAKDLLERAKQLGITPENLEETGIFSTEQLMDLQFLCKDLGVPYIPKEDIEEPETDSSLLHQIHPSLSTCSSVSTYSSISVDHVTPVLRKCTVEKDQNEFTHPSTEQSISPTKHVTFVEVGGVSIMQTSLKSLTEFSNQSKVNLVKCQRLLERDSYHASHEKVGKMTDHLVSITGTGRISAIRQLYDYWVIQLAEILRQKDCKLYNLDGIFDIPKDSNDQSLISFDKLVNEGSIDSLFLHGILSYEKTASIALANFLRVDIFNTSADGFLVVDLAAAIGESLEREIFAVNIGKKKFLSKSGLKYNQVQKSLENTRFLNVTMRKAYEKLAHDESVLQEGWIPQWPNDLKIRIGVNLIIPIIKHMKMDPSSLNFCPMIPPLDLLKLGCGQFPQSLDYAFRHSSFAVEKTKNYGIVKVNPSIFKMLRSKDNPFLIPTCHPMLVPPKLWLSFNSGGYLTYRSLAARVTHDPLQLSLLKQASKEGKLRSLLSGLDVLGKTSWVINRKVLSVLLKAWNEGLELEGVLPPALDVKNINTHKSPQKEDYEDSFAFYKASAHFRSLQNIESAQHSQRCDAFYKLEIARRFSGYPNAPLNFYFPHSVDFRGRAYPIPGHFSHIGNDLCRGLLLFGQGKPLGTTGLYWLKVHAANLFGMNKISFDERVTWTETNLPQIRHVVQEPFQYRFWLSADDPCQFLATCYELDAAYSLDRPELYVCHLPVHMDGSCNGLQHYAALGRDTLGGEKVNLAPSNKPSDIYQVVADLVNDTLTKNLSTDSHHDSKKELDLRMTAYFAGKINRKIIKTPVMTTVYGVTLLGARDQILSKLVDLKVISDEFLSEIQSFDETMTLNKLNSSAALFLARLVFNSLGIIFDRSRDIQKWLADSAQLITYSVPRAFAEKYGMKTENCLETLPDEFLFRNPLPRPSSEKDSKPEDIYPQTAVQWLTPLGFPVCQPYRKDHKIRIYTSLQSISLISHDDFCPIVRTQHVQGFPPNFIHSLDATHMFMTALSFHSPTRPFAAVHDSYWALPPDIPDLNQCLRESFVELYNQPILQQTKDNIETIFKDYHIPILVKEKGRKSRCSYWVPLKLRPIPALGSFDLEQVLSSPYFFN